MFKQKFLRGYLPVVGTIIIGTTLSLLSFYFGWNALIINGLGVLLIACLVASITRKNNENKRLIRLKDTELQTSEHHYLDQIEDIPAGAVLHKDGVKAAEDVREKVQKQAEQTQNLESLGILSGGIAHDFNNLLAVILGNATLARKHLEKDSKEEVFVSRIQKASEKAANLCRQMLAYAGKGKFTVKQINLSETVREMTCLLEVSLFKHVKVDYQLTNSLNVIEVDTAQIQQLIMNLITNANEAMKDDGGVIFVRTNMMLVDKPLENTVGDAVIKHGHYAYIEVLDEGCGMDAQTIQKIFEPFFTTKFTGRGLGMSTMLGTVQSHNGAIQIQSIVEKGTTFRVLFPAIDKLDKKDFIIEDAGQHFELELRQGKILLVDDEDVVLETMELMLEDLGYETLLAENGKQALEVYKEHQASISLVLMDMAMPEMSGKDCMIELLKLNPDVQVILSSGYTEDDISKQFEGLNLVGIVQKPFDLYQLHQAITKVMGF